MNIFVKKLIGLNLLLPSAHIIIPRGIAQARVIKNIPSVYNDALSNDVVTSIKDGPILSSPINNLAPKQMQGYQK